MAYVHPIAVKHAAFMVDYELGTFTIKRHTETDCFKWFRVPDSVIEDDDNCNEDGWAMPTFLVAVPTKRATPIDPVEQFRKDVQRIVNMSDGHGRLLMDERGHMYIPQMRETLRSARRITEALYSIGCGWVTEKKVIEAQKQVKEAGA